MQQAAANLNETIQGQPGMAGGFCAFLRLRQGSSARATWILEETRGGTMISVGSGDECDWQVRAAFVPARALSLLVVGGRTFVRSGPEPGVLLNGKPVDDGWVQVPHGARIDVGLARLEITMGYADTAEQLVESIEQIEASSRRTEDAVINRARALEARLPSAKGRTTMNLGAIPVTPVAEEPRVLRTPARVPLNATLPLSGTGPLNTTMPLNGGAPRNATPLNATMELKLEDIYIESELPVQTPASAPAPDARMREAQSGEYDIGQVLRGLHDMPAPSPLEVEEPADKRRWWLYAVAGMATAGAYGGWLVLLDRM